MGGATRNPYNVFLLGIGPMINASLITAVFTNLGEKGAWGTRLQEVTEGWKTSGVEVTALHTNKVSMYRQHMFADPKIRLTCKFRLCYDVH